MPVRSIASPPSLWLQKQISAGMEAAAGGRGKEAESAADLPLSLLDIKEVRSWEEVRRGSQACFCRESRGHRAQVNKAHELVKNARFGGVTDLTLTLR